MKYRLLSNHFFQRVQEHGGWTEPLGNNKLLWKTMSSSCHPKQKAFIGANCNNNTNHREKVFCNCQFLGVWVVSFQSE